MRHRSLAMFVLGLSVLFVCPVIRAEEKNKPRSKDLVIYYSLTGNTKAVAISLAKTLGADIARIEDSEKPLVSQLYDENLFHRMKEKPWMLKPINADLKKYDRIFIGGPVWWGEPCPEIDTFISKNNFSGKSVAIFLTMGGSEGDPILKALSKKAEARGAKIISSFSVRTNGLSESDMESKAAEIAKKYK